MVLFTCFYRMLRFLANPMSDFLSRIIMESMYIAR